MGSEIHYIEKIDEGFHRILMERDWNGEAITILTYHKDKPQGIFIKDEVKEFEMEISETKTSEVWLCSVETDNQHYNRIVVKIPSVIKHRRRTA